MIRITISAAAFEAIAATLPSSVGVEQKLAANGDYHIWLEPRFAGMNSATCARRPCAGSPLLRWKSSSPRSTNDGLARCYSDVILRLAR
jgi:hypothetical protein